MNGEDRQTKRHTECKTRNRRKETKGKKKTASEVICFGLYSYANEEEMENWMLEMKFWNKLTEDNFYVAVSVNRRTPSQSVTWVSSNSDLLSFLRARHLEGWIGTYAYVMDCFGPRGYLHLALVTAFWQKICDKNNITPGFSAFLCRSKAYKSRTI